MQADVDSLKEFRFIHLSAVTLSDKYLIVV